MGLKIRNLKCQPVPTSGYRRTNKEARDKDLIMTGLVGLRQMFLSTLQCSHSFESHVKLSQKGRIKQAAGPVE